MINRVTVITNTETPASENMIVWELLKFQFFLKSADSRTKVIMIYKKFSSMIQIG